MSLSAKSVLSSALLLAALLSSAQSQTKSRPVSAIINSSQKPVIADDGKEVIEPFNGTFRFIFTKGIKQIFTDEILKTIALNRKETEEVTLVLSPYTKVQILSNKQITANGFVPFSKSYVFEN